MIPVYKPYFPEGSLDYAKDALDSTWVSSKGKYLNKVTDWFTEYYGTEYIILTNSGTAANHLIARAIHEKYPEKKNLVCSNNSYVAAWNPFLFDNYFRLLPIDAHEKTWNMDIRNLGPDHWSNVFLIIHNLGNIVNVPYLKSKYPDSLFIEDNCEGFGGLYEGHPAGTYSKAFSLSFFGNKNITSGEGGAFVTYDEHLYNTAFEFWGQGMKADGKKFIHNSIGHNYRMTNIEAAILWGQLQLKNEIEERKHDIFERYRAYFDLIDNTENQMISFGTRHSNWMFGVKLLQGSAPDAAEYLWKNKKIETRPMFYPIDFHKHLKEIKYPNDVAEELSKQVLILPSYPDLTQREQAYIIEAVKDYVGKFDVL